MGALAATALGALASAAPALATTTTQTISSTGPLTSIILGNDLDCQVQYAGWSGGAFYPTGSLGASPATGDCGTFVSIGPMIYGPDFSENYASGTSIWLSTEDNYTAYTPGAQSGVTGSGTAGDPFAVTSSATAGASGIVVSESDRYVRGATGYTTTITLTNTTGAPVNGLLYRAVDCYVSGSDDGYGAVGTGGVIACTSSANDTSGGAAEVLEPVTGGSHYLEGFYNDLWFDIDGQTDLPDTCDCAITEDNSMGLDWDFNLAADSSAQYAVHMNFVTPGNGASIPGAGSSPGTGSSSGTSGSGGGSSSGQGNETSRHRVRLSLRQLASHHRSRAAISLPRGFRGERVLAALHGTGARSATGTVDYSLYSGRRCTAARRVMKGHRRTIRHGRVPASARVTRALAPGRYTWQVVYSGNRTLQRAKSICGPARLTILK
ncbi:MAG TPA: hypothetical protein VMF07_06030 [Solirubrobacteraceae bacterium]|nr:hypothetical protein [Solirubrobacteraceae bacterium]